MYSAQASYGYGAPLQYAAGTHRDLPGEFARRSASPDPGGIDLLPRGPAGRSSSPSGGRSDQSYPFPIRAASQTPPLSSSYGYGHEARRDYDHRPPCEPPSQGYCSQVSGNPFSLGAASYKQSLTGSMYGRQGGYRSMHTPRQGPPRAVPDTHFVGAPAPPAGPSPRRQRLRGMSFRDEWTADGPTGGMRRRASMVGMPGKHMLPQQTSSDFGKYTIVLDLDETLIYARDGPLYARPGLSEFLSLLGQRAEGVAWTAGVRPYAQAVLRNIDPRGDLKHCVYRHAKWFSGQAGYTKDLSLLGRDLDRTLIVENTPDCIRHFIGNSILLADYERDEMNQEESDPSLVLLHRVVSGLIDSGLTVPQYLATCPLLSRKEVQTDVGDFIGVNWLEVNGVQDTTSFRQNRDLPAHLRFT